MNGLQTLSYQDIVSCTTNTQSVDTAGFAYRSAADKQWGLVEEKKYLGGHFVYNEYKADLTGNFKIDYNEPMMINSVNLCLALDGNIGVNLKESGFKAGLTSLRHHAMYSYETEYELFVSQYAHVVHLAVDREYYANLLCDQEEWTATLKEKLLRKEFVAHGDAGLGREMQQAIQTIQYNPLSGNLKKLLIEAKVLELMVLQIAQFKEHLLSPSKIKSADVDTFHDLRRYLDNHFTEDLSLKSLSRQFGLNEFKLKKGFKELFESTVFDYIHEHRMNHARHLLLDQKMYVSEVASIVGYKNPNHFSTAFKRRFGMSPTVLK